MKSSLSELQSVAVPRATLVRLFELLEKDDCVHGSPNHDHTVPGKWDGDSNHVKGDFCEECAIYNHLRYLVS